MLHANHDENKPLIEILSQQLIILPSFMISTSYKLVVAWPLYKWKPYFAWLSQTIVGSSDGFWCELMTQVNSRLYSIHYLGTYSAPSLVVQKQIYWGKNLKDLVQISEAISQPFLAHHTWKEPPTILVP